MTITVSPARNEYTASAGQTIFNYTFKIFQNTDLNVYVTPAGQDANDSTDLTTLYTVTGVGDEDGGSITLAIPTNANDLVTIVSNIPSSRTTDYQNNGDFRPNVVNNDFDRVVSLVKKVEDRTNRALLLPESQQDPKPLSLPIPKAGFSVRWNGDASGLENYDDSAVSSEEIASDKVVINYPTLLAAQNDPNLKLNQACNIKERTIGNGGSGIWDVVLASSVIPNEFDTVLSTADPALALVLRAVNGVVNIRQYGAKGEPGTDDFDAIEAAIKSGNHVLIPFGTFEISGWLPVLSNQIIKFDGWLKIVGGVDFYEAVLTMSNQLNGFITDNSLIINPQIDCNDHLSANGIIFRDGTTNCRVWGGRIKNVKHGRSDEPAGLNYGGGRAINIEAGSGGLSTPSNNHIDGTIIENAYNAISVGGNEDSPEKNNSINNIIAYNCEVLIHLPGNGPTFPHTVNTAGCLISNIQGFNVGKAETYNRKHGIISGDRAANAHIIGVKVQNEVAYTSTGLGVGSVTMGEMANVVIECCEVTSDLTDIVNINSYAEVDALPVNKFGSRGLRFKIKHRGTTTNTVNYGFSYNPGLSGGLNDANPFNNIFDLDTSLVSTGLPLPAIVATYPQIYVKIYEETNNAFWEGFAEQLQSEQFANFANSRFFGAPITVSDGKNDRSGGHTIRSFAPVQKYVDLSGGAHWWETYVDANQYHMGISTDGGANWTEYFTYAANYFKAFTTNSADLGQNGVSSWRNIYSQNSVTVTSDGRLKSVQESINQELLDFALTVELKQYTLVDEDPFDDFNDVQPYHYGIIIDEAFIESLSKVVDLDACAAFCHTFFTDKDGKPITINRGGVELGDMWQVRYDEWQNILLEAMRRKVNSL